MNQPRLIPRVDVVRFHGPKETVPAFLVRSGLAVHMVPGTESCYAVSVVECGWGLGLFQSIDEAERAFVRLESLTDWNTVHTDDEMHAMLGALKGLVNTIVAECRDNEAKEARHG